VILLRAGMTDLNSEARAAIDAGRLVHLTTLNADGRPQTTVVWAGMDGDRVVIATLAETLKVRNVRRDPRVSLSLEAAGESHGLPRYLVVEGRAEVVEGGASEWLQFLSRRYQGPDVVFPAPEQRAPGFRIVVAPEKARGNGPW
jgi:PPOX class probable F420-dependent enzyme